MSNGNLNNNLISLFKLFKNRPYHLTKYLLDNSAFTKEFLEKIDKSSKLSSVSENEIQSYFGNINQMEDFYNSLLEESKLPMKLSKKDIAEELNKKLSQFIKEERYEEAAALRDYMIQCGVKKK
jgi:protein-arginine kinase activator protein McsA